MQLSGDYEAFNLVRDMLATVDVVRSFSPEVAAKTAAEVANVGKLLLTGEGSSRLFPAKNAIAHARRQGWSLQLHTEAGYQAAEYALQDWAVLAASNSGKTAEVISLFHELNQAGHSNLYSLSAFAETKLESLANRGHVLTCGEEGAVAATKSVVEQALVVWAIVEAASGKSQLASHLEKTADAMHAAMTVEIPREIVDSVASADMIYWAGRNNGVGEELTLKTNEITRKPSDFLEGTYAAHGIEEVMTENDIVLWIDPYEKQIDKFREVLVDGVGLKLFAIAHQETSLPTIVVPPADELSTFVQMAAGWNLLVETGMQLGVDLDKPERARKVGNEYE